MQGGHTIKSQALLNIFSIIIICLGHVLNHLIIHFVKFAYITNHNVTDYCQ